MHDRHYSYGVEVRFYSAKNTINEGLVFMLEESASDFQSVFEFE